MKKSLELILKSAFIAYIPIAFNFIGGFEMHLNPLDWSLQKIIIFINAYLIFFTEDWIYGEYINLAAVIVMIWLGITDISKNKDSKS